MINYTKSQDEMSGTLKHVLLGAHLHTDPSVLGPSSPQSPDRCAGAAEEAVEGRSCWEPTEHTMTDLPAGARAALGMHQKQEMAKRGFVSATFM